MTGSLSGRVQGLGVRDLKPSLFGLVFFVGEVVVFQILGCSCWHGLKATQMNQPRSLQRPLSYGLRPIMRRSGKSQAANSISGGHKLPLLAEG